MAHEQNLTPTDPWPTRRGQRLVPDPVTGEERPHQRVSTFAKTLDEIGVLPEWKAWRALIGAQRPEARDLVNRAVHADRTPKKTIDDLAEIGGSQTAAQKGTDRHTLLAAALHGADLSHLPPDARQQLDRIVALIQQLGDVMAVEFNTVTDNPQRMVQGQPMEIPMYTAGSADLLLRDHHGNPLLLDFKTGSSQHRMQWGIQTACHVSGWHWQDGQRTEPVAWARPRIGVIHAPQDGTEPRFIELGLDDALWHCWLACMVRDARKAMR